MSVNIRLPPAQYGGLKGQTGERGNKMGGVSPDSFIPTKIEFIIVNGVNYQDERLDLD